MAFLILATPLYSLVAVFAFVDARATPHRFAIFTLTKNIFGRVGRIICKGTKHENEFPEITYFTRIIRHLFSKTVISLIFLNYLNWNCWTLYLSSFIAAKRYSYFRCCTWMMEFIFGCIAPQVSVYEHVDVIKINVKIHQSFLLL